MDFFNIFSFDGFEDAIIAFLRHQAFLAPILLLILEESGIPLPVPGDLIIAYTGYQVSQGLISYVLAFVLILISTLIGSSILYYVSSRYGQWIILKVGHLMHIDEYTIVVVEKKFRKYGVWFIIFGRHIPGLRVPITIFAGISEITYKTFITSTFISVVFWIAFYLSLGSRLGKRTIHLLHSNHWYFVVFAIPLILFFISYIYLTVKHYKQAKKKKNVSRILTL